MCPAVNTPIAKPMINVPNKRAAFGNVTVKNSNFVSTACVFCKTTITATKAKTANHYKLQFIHLGLPYSAASNHHNSNSATEEQDDQDHTRVPARR